MIGRGGAMRAVRVVLAGVAAGIVVALGLVLVLVDRYEIPGEAMTPTVRADSRIWTRPADPRRIHRGDIVLLTPPGDSASVIARVVAVGGDTVQAAAGRLVLNGRPASEPYLAPGAPTPDLALTQVAPGEVFVLGDNRVSAPSAGLYGPVPASSVTETVIRTDAPDAVAILLAMLGAAVFFFAVLLGPRLRRRPVREPVEPPVALTAG
ncbi:MAG: signal peptidase I [Acidimicrobiales bacterium]